MTTTFCQYRANGLGFCGMYLKTEEEIKSERCSKHKGLVSRKKSSSRRFRGNSKYQKEVLGYKSTKE